MYLIVWRLVLKSGGRSPWIVDQKEFDGFDAAVSFARENLPLNAEFMPVRVDLIPAAK